MKKKVVKKVERNRFAHLAQELVDFKAGKIKMQVSTVNPPRVWYETYAEMKARHAAKKSAAAEFKQLRKDMGFTQGSLAEAMRVPRRTLEGWESGRNPIDPLAQTLLRVMHNHPEIQRELAA